MLSYLVVTLKNETKLVNNKNDLPKNKKIKPKTHLPKNNKNISDTYTCRKCFFGYDDLYGECESY